MALFRSPTVAWLGDLYLPDDRSKANGIINLMGGVGALIAFFVGGMLYENYGRAAPFIAGGALLVVASLVAVWKVREPRQIEVEEEKSANVLGNLKVMFQNPDKSGIFVLVSILFWFMGYNALEAGLSSFAVFTLGHFTWPSFHICRFNYSDIHSFCITSWDARYKIQSPFGDSYWLGRHGCANAFGFLHHPKPSDLCGHFGIGRLVLGMR